VVVEEGGRGGGRREVDRIVGFVLIVGARTEFCLIKKKNHMKKGRPETAQFFFQTKTAGWHTGGLLTPGFSHIGKATY
jgi:hypothetical protein